jgi:gamma-glutamyltranspeptidase
MALQIVIRDGVRALALGSAGSNLIPPIVNGVISNVVDRRSGVGRMGPNPDRGRWAG